MNYVIDSSVAFKWVVAEADTPKAIRLRDEFRQGFIELLAPDLFPTELGNALLMAERRGRIQPGEGATFFVDVLTTPPLLHSAIPLLTRAYEAAHQTRATLYDCLYVALAEREGVEFVTADMRLVNNLQSKFPFVIALDTLP